MNQHEYTVFTFAAFDPAKKYSSFSFREITSMDEGLFYLETGCILRHEGYYYQMKKPKAMYSNGKAQSRLEFKNGREVLFSKVI